MNALTSNLTVGFKRIEPYNNEFSGSTQDALRALTGDGDTDFNQEHIANTLLLDAIAGASSGFRDPSTAVQCTQIYRDLLHHPLINPPLDEGIDEAKGEMRFKTDLEYLLRQAARTIYSE